MPKLTKRFIDSQAALPADRILWDDSVSGFGIRLMPSGRKAYVIQYRTASGQSKRLTIGPHGTFTVDSARTHAQALLQKARTGGDPAAEKRALRNAPTIADLAERYLTRHAARFKKPSSCRSDDSNLRNHILPALGRRKVSEITRADVLELHEGMAATPGAANRVLALLSKMFNLAEAWDLRPCGQNPCRLIERYPEKKMNRFLSGEEMARLGVALCQAEEEADETADFSVVAAIRLLIFTGARLGEILTLRWSEVDFDRQCLHLSDSKTGPKDIHLNPPALEVLASIRSDGSEWVLRGRRADSPLVNLRKPWHRIRECAGLDNLRLHDLRHSFASVGVAGGLSLPIIGGLLGHANPATTARYAHLAVDPLKQANDMIGMRIAAALKRPSASIVNLDEANQLPRKTTNRF